MVIPIVTQHYPMLQRNLHTGITCGKRLVVLVGQGHHHQQRHTWLPLLVEVERMAGGRTEHRGKSFDLSGTA